MNFNTFLSNRFIFVTFLLGTLAFPAFAQYGGYGNQYGGYNTGGSGGYGVMAAGMVAVISAEWAVTALVVEWAA